ncbi:MAG: terminase [Chloroflexus sp.]|nr:MAG: terminase [Chloroflexus sp.]
MRGRKPKPTALKILAGNPGRRPLNDAEPQFAAGDALKPPAHLDRTAKLEWRRVIRELSAAGLVKTVDRSALAAYCQAYSQWVKATKELRDSPLTLTSPSGYVYPNPMLGIQKRALETMHKFMTEFGMTPSSRSRVKVEKAEEPDELDKLLFGENVKVKNG